MAVSPGKLGTVLYAGGNVASIHAWSMDVGTDMLDVTAFTTAAPQWREFKAGLSTWTGSLTARFDSASTGQNTLITNTITPTTAALVLEKDQTLGGKYNGSSLLSGQSVSVPIEGTVDVTFNFQGTGALTYTTST